jgi:hypothetical protein
MLHFRIHKFIFLRGFFKYFFRDVRRVDFFLVHDCMNLTRCTRDVTIDNNPLKPQIGVNAL